MTKNTYNKINNLIEFCFVSHGKYAIKNSNKHRRHDNLTPYGIHPTWCAMTILTETKLSELIRTNGYQALLLHDILEDTNRNLPNWISSEVKDLIKNMTFESFEKERQDLFQKPPEIKLLKLYDKVSNLLDGSWMDNEKLAIYKNFTKMLIFILTIFNIDLIQFLIDF